jgi:hypothetical protein
VCGACSQRAAFGRSRMLHHSSCIIDYYNTLPVYLHRCSRRSPCYSVGHRSATAGHVLLAAATLWSARRAPGSQTWRRTPPPSQSIARSLPLHAHILARDERSPGERVLPEPDQDATYAPNIVEEVALFNHNYVQAAEQRGVGLAWMANHRARGTGGGGQWRRGQCGRWW